MDDRATDFGAQLRRYREGAGLTQEALAERAGLAPSAVAALERGRRKRPYPHTVRRLAAALRLDPEQRAPFEAAGHRPRTSGVPALPVDETAGRAGAGREDVRGQGREETVAGQPAPPSNLPAPRTALFGRAGEAAAVADLVGRGEECLITLTGVGGVGKTRLALQVAVALRDRPGAFPGGVWLVELAPVADPTLVPHAVAAALGVREAPGEAPLDALVTFARPRALLLVLDNCEHLLDACAALAERLLAACPAMRILATSREPLQVAGEVQRRVAPLAVPDPDQPSPVEDLAGYPAVQLFVARARAVAPDFALTPETAAAVAQVCARLAGIPLALELAAARVGVLSAAQIAARLDDCLRLLTGGSRAGPTRQQTLRAALDWSHDLVAAPERVAFRRLAVFAGGFDLEAAEAVCGDVGGRRAGDATAPGASRPPPPVLRPSEVLDALSHLVHRSLVVAEPGGRTASLAGAAPRASGCWSRCASTRGSAWPPAARRRPCGGATWRTTWRWPSGRSRGCAARGRPRGWAAWRPTSATSARRWRGRSARSGRPRGRRPRCASRPPSSSTGRSGRAARAAPGSLARWRSPPRRRRQGCRDIRAATSRGLDLAPARPAAWVRPAARRPCGPRR